MAHEWKNGDRAMVTVQVSRADGANHHYVQIGQHGEIFHVPVSYIEPLPPALTPEAQVVLDAAVVLTEYREDNLWDKPFGVAFYEAVTAYRATLPTPEDELRAAEAALLDLARSYPVPKGEADEAIRAVYEAALRVRIRPLPPAPAFPSGRQERQRDGIEKAKAEGKCKGRKGSGDAC